MPDITRFAWATDIHLDHASPEAAVRFFDWVRSSGAEAYQDTKRLTLVK